MCTLRFSWWSYCTHERIHVHSTENGIVNFFSALSPILVHTDIGVDGKTTGKANVNLMTHEVAVASHV